MGVKFSFQHTLRKPSHVTVVLWFPSHRRMFAARKPLRLGAALDAQVKRSVDLELLDGRERYELFSFAMRPRGAGEGLSFADPIFNWSLILPVEEYCRRTGRPPASIEEWRIAIFTEAQDRVQGPALDVISNKNVKQKSLQAKN